MHDDLQGGLSVRKVIAGKTRAVTSKCAANVLVREGSWRRVTLDGIPGEVQSREAFARTQRLPEGTRLSIWIFCAEPRCTAIFAISLTAADEASVRDSGRP